MLHTLSVCCCQEQLLLGIPVNLLVSFSPSGSLAEFRPFPILFLDYSELGFAMVLAVHSPRYFNLKF